jgi:hypothetical protein
MGRSWLPLRNRWEYDLTKVGAGDASGHTAETVDIRRLVSRGIGTEDGEREPLEPTGT